MGTTTRDRVSGGGFRVSRTAKQPSLDVGLRSARLEHDPLGIETALARGWQAECAGNPHVNGGVGLLELLCSEPVDPEQWRGLGFGPRKPLVELDQTHRAVAATVIQWLGSNVGRGFLMETFRDAGYDLVIRKRDRKSARPQASREPNQVVIGATKNV